MGPESATLNARGTADDGPARSHFEYWLTGSSRVGYTHERRWPDGATGPFSEKLTGLASSSSYSFRVCGENDSGGPTSCAQARTFATGKPVEDSVTGSWNDSPGWWGEIKAHSGPSGQNPQGYIRRFSGVNNSPSLFEGFVTCVAVSGHRAAVGAVGHETVESPPNWHPATLLATVEDNGASGVDTLALSLTQGSTPPNCATASFSYQPPLYPDDELIVNDAP